MTAVAIALASFCSHPVAAAAPAAKGTTTTRGAVVSPKRILILNSFGREFAPFSVFSMQFRADLAQRAPGMMDFYNVSLESARFADGQQDGPFVDYIHALFADRPADLVVSMGGPAARFVQRNRHRLFPDTPALLAAVDERLLNSLALTDRDTAVAVRNVPAKVLQHILQVRPETKNVAVILGNSPLEKFWLAETQREFAPMSDRINFIWLSGMSFDEMRKRAAALPPNSAIFYAVMAVDVDGVLYEDEKALESLHAVANAPIFGLHDYQLGHGVVGGPLMSVRELSADSAAVAARILGGEPPGSIKVPTREASAPQYDWRELRRWGIDQQNLPAGSVIQFRELTFWEQYRWRVIGVASVCVAEAVLIVVLLMNRAHRRRAERSLRESEARFRTIADAAPVLIWMAAADKRCTFVNKGWLDFRGRTFEQELGHGWAEGLHPEDRQACLDAFADAFERRQTFTREYRVRDAGGEYRWVLGSGVPRVSPTGEFLGYIGSAIDITDRKLAEDRFRQVVEAAPNAMIMINLTGEIALVNAQTEAVFGYSRDELVGQTIEMILPEPLRASDPQARDDDPDAPPAAAVGGGGGRGGREVFGRRKDGSPVPVEVGLNPVNTPQGKFLLASVTDVTARLQAQAEVKQQRDELAHLSRVAMLGELSGSLAHELNQPLTAILSNAEAAQRYLAQQPANLQELREILEDIVQDDNRAGEIIRRLRLLFKKGQLQRNELDVNETIRDVLKLVNSDLLNHSVSVETELQEGLSPVSADRVQVQQVLLNLVVNGCDAMAQTDTPNRRLMVRTAACNGSEIVVSVADRGCGIPGNRLEQVFAPFFTTKNHGMGLGLTVCRTIVAAHGGRLWATNNQERGATFHIALPSASNGSKT